MYYSNPKELIAPGTTLGPSSTDWHYKNCKDIKSMVLPHKSFQQKHIYLLYLFIYYIFIFDDYMVEITNSYIM